MERLHHTVESRSTLLRDDGEEVSVVAFAEWFHSDGQEHPYGWHCTKLTANDERGTPLDLTGDEFEQLRDELHPDRQPDIADFF